MPRYDASNAECHVFTFKEGLLARAAHDLRLAVRRFHVDLHDDGIDAEFDATSLRACCAVLQGRDDPTALSAKDLRDIDDNVARAVLDVHRHPTIVFHARGVAAAAPGGRLMGQLTLRGRQRPVQVQLRLEGARRIAEVELHQPDFGIKPFSALLGAMKIQPQVKVVVQLPST